MNHFFTEIIEGRSILKKETNGELPDKELRSPRILELLRENNRLIRDSRGEFEFKNLPKSPQTTKK